MDSHLLKLLHNSLREDGPGYFVLKPESTDPGYRPIVVDRDFRVQGVVTRVLKKGSAAIGETVEEGTKTSQRRK